MHNTRKAYLSHITLLQWPNKLAEVRCVGHVHTTSLPDFQLRHLQIRLRKFVRRRFRCINVMTGSSKVQAKRQPRLQYAKRRGKAWYILGEPERAPAPKMMNHLTRWGTLLPLCYLVYRHWRHLRDINIQGFPPPFFAYCKNWTVERPGNDAT